MYRVELPAEELAPAEVPFVNDHLVGPVSGQGDLLDKDFADTLIRRLGDELARRSSAARSADPATLSRVARELATLALARLP